MSCVNYVERYHFFDVQMSNPAIQNDFSYYRRTMNRRKMVGPGRIEGVNLFIQYKPLYI